jgi:hypothetical protein
MLVNLNDDEIQVLLKLLTEDQLAISLEHREVRPHSELTKHAIWEKLHDALDALGAGPTSIH